MFDEDSSGARLIVAERRVEELKVENEALKKSLASMAEYVITDIVDLYNELRFKYGSDNPEVQELKSVLVQIHNHLKEGGKGNDTAK